MEASWPTWTSHGELELAALAAALKERTPATDDSALHHALQRVEESGIGNDRGFRALDPRLPFRPQSGDRKRHGDAVIAEGINLRALQGLASGNLQAILAFVDLRSHGAKIGGDGRNPVRFLYPQLARIANLDPAVRVRRNRRQHRDFVDQRGGIGARDA